jgi:hypothetical protein
MNKTVSNFLAPRNHFFGVKILKFFDADPGSGSRMKKFGSGTPDGKKSDPESGKTSRIRNTGCKLPAVDSGL